MSRTGWGGPSLLLVPQFRMEMRTEVDPEERDKRASLDQWDPLLDMSPGDRGGFHATLFREIVKEVMERVSVFSGPVLALDIGCGMGNLSSMLADALLQEPGSEPHKFYGLDSDPKWLEVAKTQVARSLVRDGRLELLQADAREPIPFESGEFNLVTASCVLHLTEPWVVLREIARLLRPGGLLIIVEPKHSNDEGVVKTNASVEMIDRAKQVIRYQPYPYNTYWRSLIRNSGFHIISRRADLAPSEMSEMETHWMVVAERLDPLSAEDLTALYAAGQTPY